MTTGYTKGTLPKSDIPVKEASEQVMYCGPNIPSKGIFTYQVYLGGLPFNVKEMIAEIPEIESLIVPVSECEELRMKIKKRGTLEHSYYESIKGKVNS